MQTNLNTTCSSHMPVLMELLAKFPQRHVIEFGTGVFSTELFVNNCNDFTSIESGNGEWFGFMKRRLPTCQMKFRQELEGVLEEVKPCDMIFVDGHFREQVTPKAFTCASTIVCHDSQYEWTFQLEVPPNFQRIDFTRFPVMYPNHEQGVRDDRPWTTMFSTNQKIIDHFTGIEDKLYTKYVFPYGINLILDI